MGANKKLKNASTDKGSKPADASDIKTLRQAKEEIKRLRKLEKVFLEQQKNQSNVKSNKNDDKGGAGNKPKLDNGKSGLNSPNMMKEARAAVMAKAVDKNYIKPQIIPKSDSVKQLIYKAIQHNTLFRACSEEELNDLVDVFKSENFTQGSTVIQQGDPNGEHFYVVESGSLDIFVKQQNEQTDISVGLPYVSGSAFGELALMYGSPRAATIRVKEDCLLWSIDRQTFRGITGQHKLKRAEADLNFLRKVKIGDKVIENILNESDIYNMALACQHDSFQKGDVIVREGERGDVFYLIESGTVDVFKKDTGDNKPVATLQSGNFFGEKALLSEDVRQATCVATSDVKCLFLMRDDFVLMLGNLQDLLDGNIGSKSNNNNASSNKSTSNPLDKASSESITSSSNNVLEKTDEKIQYELSDLDLKQTLGVGAFGRIRLAKVKSSSKHSTKHSSSTYAVKCLSKRSIVDNGLQDHVLNEKVIMDELDHPFILKYYCAMQDEKNIYFVLELLLGGELFKSLRQETQFPESWSKFYAASVLLAFCQIHARKIAYRDLKPENLVMDSSGYLKIVDFGLAKKLENGKTWTLCGTPDYLAPEVILNEGHDWAVDYWALGVLIYEMTAGTPPFYADDPMEVYEKILSGHVYIPAHFSRGLSDLIRKLLKTYQGKRMGRTRGGTSTVMKHKWFSGFDWDALLQKKLKVPIKPKVKHDEDASNFDHYPEDENIKDCPEWFPNL